MIADRIDTALTPLNEVADSLVNSAAIASEQLKKVQDEVLSLPTTIMKETQKNIDNAVKDIQEEVNNVVNNYLKPLEALENEAAELAQGIEDITNNVTTPFEVAEEGIEDITNYVTNVDSLFCALLSSLIQMAVSQLMGMITSMQRSALAAMSKAANNILGIVESVLELPAQVLPNIVKGVKKAIEPTISSVLAPIATLNSIVEALPSLSGNCDSLAGEIEDISNLSSLLSQSTLGKDLLSKLLDTTSNNIQKAGDSAKEDIYSKLDEWILSPYIEDSVNNSTDTVNKGIATMEEVCSKLKEQLENPGTTLLYPSEVIQKVNDNFEHLKDIIYKFCNNLATYEELVEAANRVADDLFILSELADKTGTSIPCDSEDTIRNLPEHILSAKTLNNGFCVAEEFIEIVQDIQDETNRCMQMIYEKNNQFKDNLQEDLDSLIGRLETLKPLVDKVKEDTVKESTNSFNTVVSTTEEGYNKLVEDLTESLKATKEYSEEIFDNVIGVTSELVDTEEKDTNSTKCDR